MRLTKL